MKKQAFNPYLPLNEYIPDGEPRLFDGRIYIYGSHDKAHGDKYCLLDYVCYSASEEDLSDWRYEGVIYKRSQDPNYYSEQYLYAPDVVKGIDGRYYLYYVMSNEMEVAVAVCDTPGGMFEYYGRVHYPNGELLHENVPFDPGLLRDGKNTYLYYGFAPAFPIHRIIGSDMPGASVVKLDTDMLTVIEAPSVILPSKKYALGTEFEGHAFFEACSIRKIQDTYYLIYASELSHELCYAYSKYPDKEFHFGGIVISNADIGYEGRPRELANNSVCNNHGGLVCAEGKWYIFYHRHTHGTQFSRQGCAEPVIFDEKKIRQAEVTSCGLNGGPLEGIGKYPAAIACNLYGKVRGADIPYAGKLENQPFITSDRDSQFITNFDKNATAVLKYFQFKGPKAVSLEVRGEAGKIQVSTQKKVIAEINFKGSDMFRKATGEISGNVHGVEPVILQYKGKGSIDILSIEFNG